MAQALRRKTSVGVDLGGTKTLAVICSESAGVTLQDEIATTRDASPDVVLGDVAGLVERIAARAGVAIRQLAGVGIGVPGLVSPDRIFIDSIILPSWRSVDIGSWLSRRLDAKIVVDNDATMAAIAEWTVRQPSDIRTLLCLTLGTGVGAAVIIDSEP